MSTTADRERERLERGQLAYAQGVLRARCAAVMGTGEGARNCELAKASWYVGRALRFGLSPAEAEAALVAAGCAVGLPESEAVATVRAGLRAGAANPGPDPNLRGGGGGAPPVATAPVADPPVPPAPRPRPRPPLPEVRGMLRRWCGGMFAGRPWGVTACVRAASYLASRGVAALLSEWLVDDDGTPLVGVLRPDFPAPDWARLPRSEGGGSWTTEAPLLFALADLETGVICGIRARTLPVRPGLKTTNPLGFGITGLVWATGPALRILRGLATAAELDAHEAEYGCSLFVVEGELDGLALATSRLGPDGAPSAAWGLTSAPARAVLATATGSIPRGATAPACLRGRTVTLCVDKDDAGRAHADRSVAWLERAGAVVVEWESPIGKDFNDYLLACTGPLPDWTEVGR